MGLVSIASVQHGQLYQHCIKHFTEFLRLKVGSTSLVPGNA